MEEKTRLWLPWLKEPISDLVGDMRMKWVFLSLVLLEVFPVIKAGSMLPSHRTRRIDRDSVGSSLDKKKYY